MNRLRIAVDRIGMEERLDALADPVAGFVKRRVPQGRVKDALSGVWLGHPVHPMFTDIPIGSFTSATVLDLVGGRRGHHAADMLVTIGVLSAMPTAVTGASDWSDTTGSTRRVGIVHALANVVGVALYAASLRPRRQGRRVRGTLLGLAGMSVMTVGGYLGGELSYARAVGVDKTNMLDLPDDWTPVLDDAALADGETKSVEVDGLAVLLHRSGGRIAAIANRCSHAGGPLGDGTIDADACTVECPWHGSVFRMDEGSVVHGPATAPQPAFEVRTVDGRIEVRVTAG